MTGQTRWPSGSGSCDGGSSPTLGRPASTTGTVGRRWGRVRPILGKVASTGPMPHSVPEGSARADPKWAPERWPAWGSQIAGTIDQ